MYDFLVTLMELLSLGGLVILNIIVWSIVGLLILIAAVVIVSVLYVGVSNIYHIPGLLKVMWKFRKVNHPKIFGKEKYVR